mmetsp:Transcript_60934/g.164321  ORF Transcript_60934/g.164321 Transcript_60934/m.164321 type:complete len:202 (+) Transcript_60934:279-884(+)
MRPLRLPRVPGDHGSPARVRGQHRRAVLPGGRLPRAFRPGEPARAARRRLGGDGALGGAQPAAGPAGHGGRGVLSQVRRRGHRQPRGLHRGRGPHGPLRRVRVCLLREVSGRLAPGRAVPERGRPHGGPRGPRGRQWRRGSSGPRGAADAAARGADHEALPQVRDGHREDGGLQQDALPQLRHQVLLALREGDRRLRPLRD